MEVATPPPSSSARGDHRASNRDHKNNSTRGASEPAALALPGAVQRLRQWRRGPRRGPASAGGRHLPARPRAPGPAILPQQLPPPRGPEAPPAAARGGAAPQSRLRRPAHASRSRRPAPAHRWEPPRVGVGAIPSFCRARRPLPLLTLPGAWRLPLLRRPSLPSPRPGAVGCCGPCAARAARHRHLPPGGRLRGTGRPGSARGSRAPRPPSPATRTPTTPAPSPTPELSGKKTPRTHLRMDGRLSHRLVKLLEGVHRPVGRFGHGVGAAFLLFNNVGSARSAARVVGHVGTAEAGCCQYQGFLRILKL